MTEVCRDLLFVIGLKVWLFTGYENIQLDFEFDQWTDLSSRGGLIHISDTLYNFFVIVETEFRCACTDEQVGERSTVIQRIIQDEDVEFYWTMVAVNWHKEEADALLQISSRNGSLYVVFHMLGVCWSCTRKRLTSLLKNQKGYGRI